MQGKCVALRQPVCLAPLPGLAAGPWRDVLCNCFSSGETHKKLGDLHFHLGDFFKPSTIVTFGCRIRLQIP